MSPRALTRLFTILAAALAASTVWLFAGVQHDTATDSLRQAEATHRMLAAAEARDAALRAFLDTGRGDYLRAFAGGERRFHGAAAELQRSAPVDNPSELRLIDGAVRLGNDVNNLATAAITARLGGDRTPPRADAVRRQLLTAEFRGSSERLLDHLGKQRAADFEFAAVMAILLVLDVAALFGFVAWQTVGRRATARARRHADEAKQHERQVTFAQSLQYVETEDAAAILVKRHLEESIPGARVAVLGSDELATVSEFALHMPLLAQGKVFGSVIVEHDAPIADASRRCAAETVAQAGPVVANLRNLAVAELNAATDALTGLANRSAVHDTLQRMVAQANRSEHSLAAVTLDLDHFRQINERAGHDKGDDVLVAAADVLSGTLRASDFAGRHGGEEFIVLLPDTDLDGAMVAAEKLRRAIAEIDVDGVDRPVSASFGIAVYPADAPDSDTLLRNAERALGSAKGLGRNRVEAWALAVPAASPAAFSSSSQTPA